MKCIDAIRKIIVVWLDNNQKDIAPFIFFVLIFFVCLLFTWIFAKPEDGDLKKNLYEFTFIVWGVAAGNKVIEFLVPGIANFDNDILWIITSLLGVWIIIWIFRIIAWIFVSIKFVYAMFKEILKNIVHQLHGWMQNFFK